MPGFGDRLTRELERAARPPDATGAFERVDRRRAKLARQRKVGSASLVVVVLAGTLGGLAFLRDAFREGAPPRGGIGAIENGAIVVARHSGDGSSLWVTRAGTVERRLTAGSNISDTAPAISPDGERVAFVRVDEELQDLAANGQIWSIDIDGLEERSISPPGWLATEPAWSPDGSRIAFVGSDGSTTGVFTMTSEGTNMVALISDLPVSPDHPTWSPDGKKIAFAAVTEPVDGSQQEPLNWDLYTLEVGKGAVAQLTDTPGRNEMAPSWAPSGDQIVFTRVANALEDGSNGGLALIAEDGTGLRELTSEAAFEQNPTWSPDGSLIAFDRDDPEGQSIYTIRPDGTELTRVTLGIDPAWQPLPEDTSATPSPSPTPRPSPSSADAIENLGWAFPVCNARSRDGDFDGNGTTDVAYVATKMSDAGGCPQADQATNVLGVDLDGDGSVDSEGGPIACEPVCLPWVATDLDVDGADELFVAQLVGPIVGLTPYRLVDGGALVPITFEPPGDPNNDLPSGEPPMLYIGGDEGFAARLECSPTEAGAVLNATTGDLDSIEQPTTWTVRQTIFRMDGDRFRVLDSLTSQEPAGDQGPFGSAVDPQLCGEPFPPNPAFPPAS